MLTDYLETQITESAEDFAKMRLQLAWAMTVLLIATIFINFMYTFINFSWSMIKRLRARKFCNRAKLAKSKATVKILPPEELKV